MLNEQDGVNGRKITLISLDDGYSPPKTVELTRRLVELDQVAFIFQSLGTAANSATRRYLNDRHIPQLFIGSSASRIPALDALTTSMPDGAGPDPVIEETTRSVGGRARWYPVAGGVRRNALQWPVLRHFAFHARTESLGF
jgi:hypothetical protein